MSADTWGTIGHLTSEQALVLEEFKRKAELHDLELAKFSVETLDSASLRFLRARQFDITKSLALLSECVTKKTTGKALHYSQLTADECAQCNVKVLKKWYPHCCLGYDKLRRPILFEASGRISEKQVLQMTSFDNLLFYHWWTMETELDHYFCDADNTCSNREVAENTVNSSGQASEQNSLTAAVDGKQTDRNPISTLAVLDLAGLNFSHCASTMLKHMQNLISTDNSCYPEILGKMLVINSPWLAVSTWEIVRRWLDPRTQAKIEILGSGPQVSKKLLEYIDADVLPSTYGGNAPDPVETCASADDNSDYVEIPRHGALKKVLDVPPQSRIYIESYVTDGEFELEVYSTPIKQSASTGNGYNSAMHIHPSYEIISNASSGSHSANVRPIPVTADTVLLNKLPLKRNGNSTTPLRVKLEFDTTDQGASFTCLWSNKSSHYARPLIFALQHQPLP